MVIGNGFFSDTIDDALNEMQSRCGCEVKVCVFPTIGNLIYYISRHGDLYSMQKIQGKCLTRGPNKPASSNVKGKRRDGGITHRLKENQKREKWIKAELLVYCSFILGRWDEDLQLEFVNGKATDIRPENIREKREPIPQEWKERMRQYADIYEGNFRRVADSIKWWCGISLEDAKDVAQSTFIWLCTTGYKDKLNESLWIYWGKKRGIDFFYKTLRHYDTENFDLIIEVRGNNDKPYETDLFHLQKGEKRSRYLTLWAQGHRPTEIAEMTGSTSSTCASSVTRSIQFLQKYLKHEEKYLRT